MRRERGQTVPTESYLRMNIARIAKHSVSGKRISDSRAESPSSVLLREYG